MKRVPLWIKMNRNRASSGFKCEHGLVGVIKMYFWGWGFSSVIFLPSMCKVLSSIPSPPSPPKKRKKEKEKKSFYTKGYGSVIQVYKRIFKFYQINIILKTKIIKRLKQGVVVHTCNPCTLGSWGKRITNSSLAWATYWPSKNPISK